MSKVGVIIGRFQVSALHDGHIELFETCLERSDTVIVLIGTTVCRSTERNPLPFEARKQLVQQRYPNAIIRDIPDQNDNAAWSKLVDKTIQEHVVFEDTVCLYGSRQSFIPAYSGIYESFEIVSSCPSVNATELRKSQGIDIIDSEDFRRGIIWSSQYKWDICHPVVDIAPMIDANTIVLGKRDHEEHFRFVGGFVDPSETFEEAAIRETKEETSLDLHEPRYLASHAVDDPRYRAENDKLVTAFFVARATGVPSPQDDIDSVCIFSLSEITEEMVVTSHRPLLRKLQSSQEAINAIFAGDQR